MKQLLILLIFFVFTKEKITYQSNNKIYSYNENCKEIETFFDSKKQPKIDDYPLNAQFCRLNDPNITELEAVQQQSTEATTTSPTSTLPETLRRLRNLEVKSQINKDDKCCYVSILSKEDNSDWLYFCGRINSTIYDNKVSKYVEQIKEREDFKNKYKDIKIDCFSKKLSFMINVLIISLFYLI